MKVGPGDWPQWGGWTGRNNTPRGREHPHRMGHRRPARTSMVRAARLADLRQPGRRQRQGVTSARTTAHGYLSAIPNDVDLGCLLCFDVKTANSSGSTRSEKLPTGRVHDWPAQGICCCAARRRRPRLVRHQPRRSPLPRHRRLSRRRERRPLHQDEEVHRRNDEADVIWDFDMMKELGISQHNMCSCSVTAAGDLLFVSTSNGVDDGHINIPAPDAPSFFAMDKNTGKVLWTDNSPGINILHGQWSSPAYARARRRAAGDLRRRRRLALQLRPARATADGNAKLLWKFDCNPKESPSTSSAAAATRNHIIGTPVIYDGLVYVAVGEDPEHGEGIGHLWCIDPDQARRRQPRAGVQRQGPHQRRSRTSGCRPCVEEDGDFARPNPNSAVVWHYAAHDTERQRQDRLRRDDAPHLSAPWPSRTTSCTSPTSAACSTASTPRPASRTGRYDMLAAAWGSPLIVDDKVYIGDEDGDVTVFKSRHRAGA